MDDVAITLGAASNIATHICQLAAASFSFSRRPLLEVTNFQSMSLTIPPCPNEVEKSWVAPLSLAEGANNRMAKLNTARLNLIDKFPRRFSMGQREMTGGAKGTRNSGDDFFHDASGQYARQCFVAAFEFMTQAIVFKS